MKEQAVANAFASLMAIIYVVCAGWVLVSRNTFMSFFGTWVHGIDMKALPYNPPSTGGLIIGFITAVIAAWVTAYLFVWLYKYFAKK